MTEASRAMALVAASFFLLYPLASLSQADPAAQNPVYFVVTVGSSDDLGRYRVLSSSSYEFVMPEGRRPKDVVGMATDGKNGTTFVWFKDGWVTGGSSRDLDEYRKPYRYTLPYGYETDDIVDLAVDEYPNTGAGCTTFVWFKDYRYACGTSDNLTNYTRWYNVARDHRPQDIVAIAIDGENNSSGSHRYEGEPVVIVWYKDGWASKGSPSDFESVAPLYHYTLPTIDSFYPEPRIPDIMGMTVDGTHSRVYTWWRLEKAPRRTH